MILSSICEYSSYSADLSSKYTGIALYKTPDSVFWHKSGCKAGLYTSSSEKKEKILQTHTLLQLAAYGAKHWQTVYSIHVHQ